MNRTRRQFLSDLGFSIGAIPLVRGLAQALPAGDDKNRPKALPGESAAALSSEVDFSFAPSFWQTTFCFPDDPRKSLVGKRGELLYDHAGVGEPLDKFGTTVAFGLAGGEGEFIRQELSSPSVPIVTTVLRWKDADLVLTTFATRSEEEGRVDNVLVEIHGRGKSTVTVVPEILITSVVGWTAAPVELPSIARGKATVVTDPAAGGRTLCIVDAPAESHGMTGGVRLSLAPATVTASESARYLLRFPLESQAAEKIQGRMPEGDKLVEAAGNIWKNWKPFGEPVGWSLLRDHQNFLIASARNIVQSREIKNGKKIFQVGPTVYRGLWLVDGYFLLEAARFLGYDADAKEGMEAIWSLQKDDGSFSSDAGPYHWKDTAAAVLLLVRQAELTQDWDLFNQHYPDAWKAMMYLRDLAISGQNDGTPNARYGLLPEGFGDSGIGGKSAEVANTIWALMAIRAISETADRLFLQRRVELREFYTQLRINLNQLAKSETQTDPRGFSYLPMLLPEDPQWKVKDPKKRPKPQSAQIYMSHLISPGMMFSKNHDVVKGHVALMKAVMREEIPAETGWLKENAVWTYNAAAFASTLLWLGQADLARKIFLGFLNHASPLWAWREEQSLKGVSPVEYVGDMPHNWASAECVRFLRHMLVLEDEKELRLLQGVGGHDLAEKRPFGLQGTPTRWGRITIEIEPAPNKRWVARYKRVFTPNTSMAALDHVIIPRWLPGKVQLEKVTGASFLRVGLDVQVDPAATSWEATWLDLSK